MGFAVPTNVSEQLFYAFFMPAQKSLAVGEDACIMGDTGDKTQVKSYVMMDGGSVGSEFHLERGSCMKTRELVLTAIFIAFSLIIPLYFGFLKVYIPPFSATIASHVPVMLAIFISPISAMLVGLGSTVGFWMTMGPVIAARAATHIVFGGLGAWLFRRGVKPWPVLLAMLPVHAVLESLIVLPFDFTLYQGFVVVGIGTAIHHLIDMAITLALLKPLGRSLGIQR